MPIDIIIFAVVAIILAFRLRDALGTQHGQERSRPNPYTPQAQKKEETAASVANENVVPLNDKIEIAQAPLPLADDGDEKAIRHNLKELTRLDQSFNIHDFVLRAKDAFPIIVEAYAASDLETLQNLVTPRLYDDFEKSIEDRREKGQKAVTEVQAVRGADLVDVTIEKSMAYVTLRFTAEETAFIRDKEGQLITGHPNSVDTVRDVWTFGRNMKGKDPRWMLFQTKPDSSSGVQEQ